jgi:zinc dependent phospholipase C
MRRIHLAHALPLLGMLITAAPAIAATDIDHRASRARRARSALMWKINTHLFAANMARADAVDDGRLTIPPFGTFPVAPAALRALQTEPAMYRAGVLAPDLFPDMYVGGWFIHSDLSASPEKWIADDWMRHVWSKARAWPKAEERDRVMAFAYGFLTHAAGDLFAHTYVSRKADGAWVTPYPTTAIRHVVLEGYIGDRTPQTDVSMDVWPRLVAELLVKDPAVREHTQRARHYQTWLKIYDWLGPQIEKAKRQMNNNVPNDAPYWRKCSVNPVACAKKEQMESWRLDINRGLRALVDSSQTLGEEIMAHETPEGVGAMTGWMKEWVPKMFGAHAIGEGAAALQEFLDWVGDPLAPITEPIKAEVVRFLAEQFPYYYELYLAVQNPSYQMDHVGFPPGTKQLVNQDMHIQPGPDSLMSWMDFEPLYNSVILSKLVLLDGNGLNELARRAGMAAPLFPASEATNVLLSVVRSMTQSYQWVGDVVNSQADSIGPTAYGICGPEDGTALPKNTLCGVRQRQYPGKGSGLPGQTTIPDVSMTELGEPIGGFVFWGHPEARAKIFGVIFKGYGPGPGISAPPDVITGLPTGSGLQERSRARRAVTEQIERMREVLTVMQGKIGGGVTAPPASAPPPAQIPIAIRMPGQVSTGRPAPTAAPATTQPEVITNWGQRCCGKDIAELRTALSIIQASGPTLQNAPLVLGRPTAQIAIRAAAVSAAIDAFESTRDAQSAAAALSRITTAIDALARLVS